MARSDIQTQYVSLYPRYADSTPASGGNGLAGYTAVNSVEARVTDLSTVGDVLDAAVAAGANNIGGIRFSVSDATELRSSARANAMQQARDQAQELAQLAGASLGPVNSITENAAGGGPILEAAADGGGAAVPVAPGSQNVQVNLQVTWLLQ